MLAADKYLATIVHLQSLFLADYDKSAIYDEIVAKLAETVKASRVVIYEKITGTNHIYAFLKSQANNKGIEAILPQDTLYNLDIGVMFAEWLRPLRSGVIVSGHLQDFNTDLQQQFGAVGVQSFTLIPICLQNQIQVLMAIYHHDKSYIPTSQEISLFNSIANQFSAYLNRKNTESKLLTYKRVLEESNLCVFVLNTEGCHIEANFAYRQLVGYDSNEELFTLTPEIIFGKAFKAWFADLKQKGYHKGEIELKDIGIVLELSSYVVHNEDGEVVSYINIANDITKRIQNEKEMLVLLQNYRKVNESLVANEYELLKSEQQLRMLAENSFEMVSLSDTDGTIVYMSPSAKKVTGYDLEELYGKNLLEFFHPEDLDMIQTQSQQQITDKQDNIVITHRFLTKSGNYIWLESFTKYLYDEQGNVANLQSSSRDVTQNVIANKALQNSEEKFRTLFDKTYDAIFIYRKTQVIENNFIEINEVACKLLGYSRQELLLLNLARLIATDEETPQKLYDESGYFQTTLTHKNGYTIPVEIATTFIYADNEVIIQAVVRDSREKKQAEETRKAKEVAEKLLQIKSDFLANMSHEIRTPMNGILGMTYFLLNSTLDEKQQHYAKTVYKSAENLLAILNDILDLSKLEANKMNLKVKAFDLQPFVKQIKELFEAVALQKNINLQIAWQVNSYGKPSTNPLWIVSDESRLLQVMTNLASNAIKFTEQGTITIKISSIKKTSSKINQIALTTQDYLLFEVIDNGIGISAENQAQLFSKFYQIDLDPHAKQQGTGLGLAICKQFVALWEGEIGVESQENKGSNFWFTLPLVWATEEQIATETKIQGQYQHQHIYFENLQVLIAEDIFVNQEVAKTMVEQIGCTADIAKNGQEAIAFAKQKQYDLILMDIQMPIMNGIAATKEIKATFEKIPVIMGVSANTMEEDAKRYIAEGMDDYIAKPIEPLLLQQKLEKWFPQKVKKQVTQEIQETQETQEQIQPIIATNTINVTENNLPETPILNKVVVDKILSLVKGNKARFEILLHSFHDDMQDLIISAKQSIADNNHQQLISAIHTIKGVTATIGTTALYEHTKLFYAQIRNNHFDETMTHIQTIENLYQQASQALDKVKQTL
jgi:PAS domain S-box-containing protein